MMIVWVTTSYIPRHSLEPLPHAASPVQHGKVDIKGLVGFLCGAAGTVLYNLPRVVQLYSAIVNRSTEGIEVRRAFPPSRRQTLTSTYVLRPGCL